MIDYLKNLARDEAGVTAVEYALIAVFISVGAIAGFSVMGASLSSMFDTVSSNLEPVAQL